LLTGDQMRNEVVKYFLTSVPRDAAVTRIEYEGTKLAIYTKNPDLFLEQNQITRDLVNLIKKRVVIRSDPSIRLPPEEAEKKIREILPPEVGVQIYFDETLGEVILEAGRPEDVSLQAEGISQQIAKETRWKPRILRAPAMESRYIQAVRQFLYGSPEDRANILRDVGERIFRTPVLGLGDVRITVLGGGQQVGKSAFLLETSESRVLIDCGISPGGRSGLNQFPRIDTRVTEMLNLDAVVISHAHLDHCGFLPYLFKYDYDGPVFCLEPTATLMMMLQLDYIDVTGKEGAFAPYGEQEVRTTLLHTIPMKYGTVTNITPDIRLTVYNAGHILGSAMLHLHIGEGHHNIVYTGDFKFEKTRLLDCCASRFHRVETLIMESTYGATPIPFTRRETEKLFSSYLENAVQRGGKVLIPVPAIGRAQEILLVLEALLSEKIIPEVPVFIDGLVNEATAIHTAYPQYLTAELQKAFEERSNPFSSDYFTPIRTPSQREEATAMGGPAIIMSTSGMLEGGPVLGYFREMAEDEKNLLAFVSYQVEGTMGRKLLKGIKEISLTDENGKAKIVRTRMEVQKVDGFSGHSSRQQLVNYLRRVVSKPRNVIVCHGEPQAVESLARVAARILPAKIYVPRNLDTMALS